MIKKLLGITDEQLVKKSNLYGYLFSAIVGGLLSILGIGIFFYYYSDTHEKIIELNYKYINYLEKVYEQVNDENLPHIIDTYRSNIKLIDNIPDEIGVFLFMFGITLIVNFILFLQLRNKTIATKNDS